MKGHWFCDRCDDVVFMTYEHRTAGMVCCPVCGHIAAHFVPHTLSRSMIAKQWFEQMRAAVDAATTPELYNQTNHRELR